MIQVIIFVSDAGNIRSSCPNCVITVSYTHLDMGTLYGKTGTGAENGRNTNGWFVGFLETDGNVYCFSLNMQDSEGASGSAASEAAVNILHDLL